MPLNMLTKGSVLTDNTASAHEANELSSRDRGLTERREDDYSRTQALPRAIERGNCTIGYGNEMRERRPMQIFHVKMSEVMAAAPTPCICKRPSVDYTVSYTYTHKKHAIHTYSLPPPPPQTHTYTETHTAPGRDRSLVFSKGRMQFTLV